MLSRTLLILRRALFFQLLLIILLPNLISFASSTNRDKLKKIDKITTTSSGKVDLCLACHKEDAGKAHSRKVFGCHVCHRGNPLAGDIDAAHNKMIINPGELQYLDKTCGQTGCHTNQAERVRNSIMATNRGIISTLQYYWNETDNHNKEISVKELMDKNLNSPAIDYYRKLCGTCHLWVRKNTMPGFLAERGGGCSACHSLTKDHHMKSNEKEKTRSKKKTGLHPDISRIVPVHNCVRCHNRSGRIGLSYQGIYESEGYGTPYHDGYFSPNELHDGRFFMKIKEDVHNSGKMACIDCHTQNEVMGDGVNHAHLENQLEISCNSCHADDQKLNILAEMASNPKLANKKEIPFINNIINKDGQFFLKGKVDKKLRKLKSPSEKWCKNRLHKRLSCQACHSQWVPQCYGCHVEFDSGSKQLDKLTWRDTTGHWKELKSWMRYETPALGVLEKHRDKKNRVRHEEIVILVPG